MHSSKEIKKSLLISGNALNLYPVELFFGILMSDDGNTSGIPKLSPISGDWGEPLTMAIMSEDIFSIPSSIDLVYLSIIERRFYSVEKQLSKERIESCFSVEDNDGSLYEYIVVGMAPYGGVAVWLCGEKKEVLIEWMKGEEVQVDMDDFLPMSSNVTLDQNCDFYIDNDPIVKENLKTNGLPPSNLFDKYMQRYTYRYQALFEKWNEDENKWEDYGKDEVVPELDSLEEMLYDGTFDKLNDGRLMRYHDAGKPKKLAIKWHVGKSEYAAYFWFVDEVVKVVFDHFYGIHPETKTDFMVRIDPQNNKYQLTMYRYGLKEPFLLSEESYELIVFRNKFEEFRSENYSQPSGDWIW